MLRPSFLPPAEIRELRDYARLRADLVRGLLPPHAKANECFKDALVKISVVPTDIFGVSGRAMLGALIDAERDPEVLANLAVGTLKHKRAALREALTGHLEEHHAEIARMLLEEIDGLVAQLAQAKAPAERRSPDPTTGEVRTTPALFGARAPRGDLRDQPAEPQVILAVVGLTCPSFQLPGASRPGRSFTPKTVQSAARSASAKIRKGNFVLEGRPR